MADGLVRIGGASGFWGDSSLGALQLVRSGKVDYLMFDYLAEVTMSLLVRTRQKDPAQGYATDFVGLVKALLTDISSRGIRIVANAGGVNPQACAAALRDIASAAGTKLTIAVVEGDDVAGLADTLRGEQVTEMFSHEAFPANILSANAYLGATPIAAALGKGADIVVTGRVADSALALGILMHEFGWRPDAWDRLASGSLVGHILECGAQATGGLHTDWEDVPDWANIGYPIAECLSDGSFTISKADNTGGLITPAVIAEQMLYEVGDPAEYLLPDVTADFSRVHLEEVGANRVRVTGAKGRPATATYKVSATFVDGWRAFGTLSVIGIDAGRKARRTADAILERTRTIFRQRSFADYRRTDIEILGTEAIYGPHSRAAGAREVVMKLGVEHEDAAALGIFAREIAPAGTSFSSGTTGFAGGRPKPTPIVRLFSFLLDKSRLAPPVVTIGADRFEVPIVTSSDREPAPVRKSPAVEPYAGQTVPVPLLQLAFAGRATRATTPISA